MKPISLFIAMAVTAGACDTDRQLLVPTSASTSAQSGTLHQTGKLDISSLSRISKISLVSKISVSLQTLDGRIVEQTSALQPNATYRLSLKGEGANKVQVRACFGFDLLSKEENRSENQLSATYLIRTQSDVTEPLMVSFIPLRTVGTSMFREQPQNFWLANKGDK